MVYLASRPVSMCLWLPRPRYLYPWSWPQSHKLFGWQLSRHSVPLSSRNSPSKSPRAHPTLHRVNWYTSFISLFDNCPIDTRELNFLGSRTALWDSTTGHTVSIKWRLVTQSPIKTLQLFTSQRQHRYTHSTREVRICTRVGRTDQSSSAYSGERRLSIYVDLISKSFSLEVSTGIFETHEYVYILKKNEMMQRTNYKPVMCSDNKSEHAKP